MTQEDKDLLFKDLCARIPYNVKCYNIKYGLDLAEEIICITVHYNHPCVQLGTRLYKLEQVRPYLFPLSSMTEEQKEERKRYTIVGGGWTNDGFDWLNKNHFDYRGLIPMGLAIDATNLNIY